MSDLDAAVAIVLTRAPEECILLIRRAERENDSWSGHWSFPGGRRDQDDPDLLSTALRELAEECGIQLARPQLEAALPVTVARRKVGRFLTVAPFLFRIDAELDTVLDPREAAASLWVPLRVLLDPANHRLQPVPGRPPEMLYPAVDLNGYPLWGFTYRLITGWLGLEQADASGPAGLEVAQCLLQFLLSHGVGLRQGWADRTVLQPDTGREIAAKAAVIEGEIPVAPVLAHFSIPGRYFPVVNCLEVRPDYIRMTGAAFEDYLIYTSG